MFSNQFTIKQGITDFQDSERVWVGTLGMNTIFMRELGHLSDTELFSLVQKGSADAFEQLFLRYNQVLYVHAYNKIREKETAKDLVQEVFAVVWSKKTAMNIPTANVSGFLYILLKNKLLDWLAKQKRSSMHLANLQHFLDEEKHDTDYRIRERQLQEQIDVGIAELPNRMRSVFELSRKEHLSHKEIADQLNISHQTVTDQVKKALRILRAKLNTIYLFVLVFLFS